MIWIEKSNGYYTSSYGIWNLTKILVSHTPILFVYVAENLQTNEVIRGSYNTIMQTIRNRKDLTLFP
jgi:hypothetical protein